MQDDDYYKPLMSECEPTADESVPPDIRHALDLCAQLQRSLSALGRDRALSIAKTKVDEASLWIARFYAKGGSNRGD